MSEFTGLECFWSNLDKHPTCPHGPTLLFGKHINGELKQFHACSACRDRKSCTFYAEKDAKFTEAQKKAWKAETKKALPNYNPRKLFLRFNEAMTEIPDKRAYCHSCSKLVLFSERSLHTDHDMKVELTDEEMNNPTTILKPLSDVKKEAQYLFSNKATQEITNMLLKAGAEQVLCIGAPRIHEYITQNFGHKISSLLMDFDGRFHNFFGPLNYCWYNLFNHHFFTEESAQTYRDFITQNSGKSMFLICDPPFGGRVEAISQTVKTISDQYKKWNSIKDENSKLKIIFIFPYFMESIMQRKSNPAGIEGGLNDLKMSDYKVDYDNHPLFVTGSSGRKYGSPVRIFTNISLNLLELPASDGYKYCANCKKYVARENKHCKKCNECTSKDGRRYKHCDVCQRCVKPTWKHCDVCERCVLEKHTCGIKPRVTGRCFTCGGTDHVGNDCSQQKVKSIESSSTKTANKRKNKIEVNETIAKKSKISVIPTISIKEIQGKKKGKNKTNEIAVVLKKQKTFKNPTFPIEETQKTKKRKTKTNGIEKTASISENLNLQIAKIQKKKPKSKLKENGTVSKKQKIVPKNSRIAIGETREKNTNNEKIVSTETKKSKQPIIKTKMSEQTEKRKMKKRKAT